MRPEPPAAAKAAASTVPVLRPGMEVGFPWSLGKNWLATPVAVQVGEHGRVDALRTDRRLPGARVRVLDLHRPAGEEGAGAVPGVDVLVHRRDHDVEEAVAVEVAQHRVG